MKNNTKPTFDTTGTFMGIQSNSKSTDDQVSVIGVPMDLGTTNRAGARFGPSAVRHASRMLIDGDHPILKLNPVNELNIKDLGNLKIKLGYLEESIKLIQDQAEDMKGHIIAIGGDHTISLPLLRAFNKKTNKKISLLHFDAHVDTWDNSFGSKYGHGTPFYYAVKENLIDANKSVQIGIRAPIEHHILENNKSMGFKIISANYVHSNPLKKTIKKIKKCIKSNLVYLTFDIDCIDPSQAPGTGTPEIGGLFTWQILHILNELKELNWCGMDLVEVSPEYDISEITSLAGATIIWSYLSFLSLKN